MGHHCSGGRTWVHLVPLDARGDVHPRSGVPFALAPRWVLGETRRHVCLPPCSGRQRCLNGSPRCVWRDAGRITGTLGLFNVPLEHMQRVVVRGGRQGAYLSRLLGGRESSIVHRTGEP